MIKKKLFLAIAISFGALFMSSCSNSNGSDTPFDSPESVNKDILGIMTKNYGWNLPDPIPDLKTRTDIFFKDILNSKDSYSWIKPISDYTPSTTAYDIGFEYAMNKYTDGNIYYVVRYVKKGSVADKLGIKRGYIITQVSPTGLSADLVKITDENYKTLLSDCVNSGKQFSIFIRIPGGQEGPFTYKDGETIVDPSKVEDPLYYSNIYTDGSKKTGYIVYNHFLSASTYLPALVSKLNEFAAQGVNNLILDLRYNYAGGFGYLSDLGRSLVKSQDQAKSSAFSYIVREDASKDIPYKFSTDNSIQVLGDQLQHIYVLTGQLTAGPAETLIHSLRAYWGDLDAGGKLIVIGENSKGENRAVSPVIQAKDDKGTVKWLYQIVLGHMGDKDRKIEYRTKVNSEVFEITGSSGTASLLKPLGDKQEPLLSFTLGQISGNTVKTSVRSVSVSNDPVPVKYLGSSVKSEPGMVSIENLKY